MNSSSAVTLEVSSQEQCLRYLTNEQELVPYQVTCHPARSEDGTVRNWSLSQLDEDSFKARLTCALSGRHVHAAYAPTVNRMSGFVLAPERFTTLFPLNRMQTVKRPGFQRNSNEKEGCDGTSIGEHDAFVMSAGGCPLVVLTGVNYFGERVCLAAHAGRDSLIDHNYVRRGVRTRVHFSVVDALVAYARKMRANPCDMTVRSFFAIPCERFPHSVIDTRHGNYNAQMQFFLRRTAPDVFRVREEDGLECLDLSRLIEWQANAHGIKHIRTGLCMLPIDGDYAYTRHAERELAGVMRNLVTLVRL